MGVPVRNVGEVVLEDCKWSATPGGRGPMTDIDRGKKTLGLRV